MICCLVCQNSYDKEMSKCPNCEAPANITPEAAQDAAYVMNEGGKPSFLVNPLIEEG